MLSTNPKQDYAYFEGKIIKTSEANVSIKTHALQYGTGCFGGIRGYWSNKHNQLYLFRLQNHFERIHQSAKILMMKPNKSITELINITTDLVKKNNWKEDIYIRPFLYKSSLNLSPKLHDIPDEIAIYTMPLGNYLDVDNGLTTKISSWIRLSDNMIPTRAKASGGYVNSALAKSEVMLEGYDEAIFLDSSGNISEASAANIFIARNNKLITPPLYNSILEGITRRSLLEIADYVNIEIEERSITRAELYIADEAFLCGTGVQIAWIKEVDKRIIGEGQIGIITKKIKERFFNIVTGNDTTYHKWLTPIY